MAYTVIRVRKGRRYQYTQESYRQGGKVKTRYLSCVALDPPVPRKRKIDIVGNLKGFAALAVTAAIGKLGPPGGTRYTHKEYTPTRPGHTFRAVERRLDEKYGIDRTSPETWRDTHARLSPELANEMMRSTLAAARTYHAAMAEAKAAQSAAAPTEAPADTAPDTGGSAASEGEDGGEADTP